MALKLYTDAACTQEFGGTWQLVHKTDLSDNPQEDVLYWAEVELDPGDNGVYTFQANSNPGTDNIEVNIVDANPGAGHEATEIKLALTAGGLDTATAGADLVIGTSFLSGATNAVPIHIRVTNAVTTVSDAAELTLTNDAILRSQTPA